MKIRTLIPLVLFPLALLGMIALFQRALCPGESIMGLIPDIDMETVTSKAALGLVIDLVLAIITTVLLFMALMNMNQRRPLRQ
jgi:hypothetical protein